MRALAVVGVVGVAVLSGCASVSEGAASMQPEAVTTMASVRVGPAHLLDAGVNPSAGVRVAADGNAVVVRFAHPRHRVAVERLDPNSLEAISQEAQEAQEADGSTTPHPNAVRVVLDGGRRFVVFWKSGDGEHGYRAMAQAFNASDGSPRGAPIAISPSDADVSGPLSAATSDGHHVVATFAASTGTSFAAYAVPVEAL